MREAVQKRYDDARMWKNRWSWLTFILGAAMVIFLIVALVLLLSNSLRESVISGFSALVSAGGFAWVLARRNEAHKEETKALRELEDVNTRIEEDQSRRDEHASKEKRAESSRRGFLGRLNTDGDRGAQDRED